MPQMTTHILKDSTKSPNRYAFAEETKKSCVRCAYFNGSRRPEAAFCGHPEAGGSLDIVMGEIIPGPVLAHAMRADGGLCGPAGTLFLQFKRS